MKLFILEARKNLESGNNPWKLPHDKCYSAIVRAENETEARKLADSKAYDENTDGFRPWLNPEHTFCTVLHIEGEQAVIMQDIQTG